MVVPGRSQVARTVTASGALAARRDQPVGVAGEGGMVTRVLVDAGAWVRQGQVLATIDRSVQSQEAAQLAANVQVARADAALAQNELDRSQSLISRGFVSKADLDRKRAARDAASARVRVAQAQLGASRARVGRLDIRAPTSGLVLARSVEVGQVVGAGAGALFRIAAGGEMEMRAQVAQQDIAALRVGMPASVRPIGLDRSFAGQVWQVSPTIDPQSRQGEVRIAVPYDVAIRPGGFAEGRISSGTTTAPLAPAERRPERRRGQLRLHRQRQERGRAARHQDRVGRRRGRDHHRRPERPGSGRAVGRAVPQPRAKGFAQAPGRAVTKPEKS